MAGLGVRSDMGRDDASRRSRVAMTDVAPFLGVCSAYNLAEARRISLAVAGRIAGKDARLFEAFSCPWTPALTFDTLL
jgi:hypothetical protein